VQFGELETIGSSVKSLGGNAYSSKDRKYGIFKIFCLTELLTLETPLNNFYDFTRANKKRWHGSIYQSHVTRKFFIT
jgi:hypothetical protein